MRRLSGAGVAWTVATDGPEMMHTRLKDEFENGKVYYAVDGQRIAAPRSAVDRPDPECLRWHNDHVFEKGRAA